MKPTTNAIAAILAAFIATTRAGEPSSYDAWSSTAYSGYSSTAKSSSYSTAPSSSCAFVPDADDYIVLAENIAQVSRVSPDESFQRNTGFYQVTSNDIGTAAQFTTPDFAEGLQCNFLFVTPTEDQIMGDLQQFSFSGVGNLDILLLDLDLTSSNNTFNNLGPADSPISIQIKPGQVTLIASIPCLDPGGTIPALVSSKDTDLTLRDSVGTDCAMGVLLVVEGAQAGGGDDYSSSATVKTYTSYWGSGPTSTWTST